VLTLPAVLKGSYRPFLLNTMTLKYRMSWHRSIRIHISKSYSFFNEAWQERI